MQTASNIHPAIRRYADTLSARRSTARAGGAATVAPGDFAALIPWMETEFYIPERRDETPPALVLADYQRAVLQEAHRQVDGKFVYDLILWSDIKKSIKSTIAAAVILYRALQTPYGSFRIVANDLKQADSRVFYYIKRALELNPALGKRATIKNYHITLDNHAMIEAVPVDPKGEAGGNDDLIEFTELHAAESKAASAMWSEMTISPTKYGYSQRWIDTYAGHSGEAPILEPLYETGVRQGQRLDLGIPGLEVYANGSMLTLWNTVPRLSWQTAAYYASEARSLLPNEFDRMHRNQWTTSLDVFVPPEAWDACQGDYPVFDARTPVVVGMDAGVSNDCFALVGVSRVGDTVYVRFVRVYRPEHGQPIDFAIPDRFIREELIQQYNVVQICYDPYQLHDMAMRLRRDSVTWLYEFTQMKPRLEADKALRDAILGRRLVHQGDATLTVHVKNANAKTPDGDIDKLRLVKRADHLKIDAAVALSMANSEARRLQIG